MSNTQKMVGILLASAVIFMCVALIILLKPKSAHSQNQTNHTPIASSVASTPMPIPTLVGNPVSEQVIVDDSDKIDYNKLVYGDNKDMTDSASGVNLDGTVNAPIQYHNTASDFSVQPQNPETDIANQLIDSSKATSATVKAVN